MSGKRRAKRRTAMDDKIDRAELLRIYRAELLESIDEDGYFGTLNVGRVRDCETLMAYGIQAFICIDNDRNNNPESPNRHDENQLCYDGTAAMVYIS